MKALSFGDYCKPKDEKEWNAILAIAQSLGIYGFGERCRPFISHGWIWANNFSDKRELAVNECTSIAVKEVSTSDFIAGMYQLAEERKKPTRFDINIQAAIEKMTKVATEAYEKECCKSDQLVGVKNLCISGEAVQRAIAEYFKPTNKQRFSDLEKRVKELEEGNIILDKDFNKYARRLEKLEKVVSEGMGERRLEEFRRHYPSSVTDIFTAPWTKVRGTGYTLKFDPKASPKNIPFEIALAYAKAGRKIRRKDWTEDDCYLYMADGMVHASTSVSEAYRSHLYMGNLTANDWYVL